MNKAKKLAEMFEADRDDPGYYNKFPMYEVDGADIGTRPWWPPLSEVWQRQGTPPQGDRNTSWAEAWDFLCQLYDEYQQSR